MKDGHMNMLTKFVDSYRQLVNYLYGPKLQLHTNGKAKSVLLKNLHNFTPIGHIEIDVEQQALKVRSIFNTYRRLTKDSLPLIYIELESSADNKQICEVKYFDHVVVKIGPPLKTRDIVGQTNVIALLMVKVTFLVTTTLIY